jgi:uncharacterized protein DUF1622
MARPAASHGMRKSIWRRFGLWLLLGLEFALAADIITSVISPTWQDIGELGAIAVIRTFLNYFLEHDLENAQKAEERAQTSVPYRNEHVSSRPIRCGNAALEGHDTVPCRLPRPRSGQRSSAGQGQRAGQAWVVQRRGSRSSRSRRSTLPTRSCAEAMNGISLRGSSGTRVEAGIATTMPAF